MTLDKIAKLAGVSRTTASYVINGKASKYRISQKTQLKVMEIVKRYNFSVNPAARALRGGSNHLLGLIIPDLENNSYCKLAKLLERNARQAGYQLIICCSDDDMQTEMKVANTLLSRRIDALLVATSLPLDHAFYYDIQAKGVPIIGIDRALNDEVFASVISEDLEGSYALTQSLLSKNINSIGLVGAVRDLGISKEREQGFLAAIKQYQPNIQYSIAYGDHFSPEQGQAQLQSWARNNHFPDAIIATSYTLFEGVLDHLLLHPELMKRTKLATFGEHRLLDFLPSKIQSLEQKFELIAERALTLALQSIKTNVQPGIDVITRKIIRR
ncbi:DNA-binding transcriptional regulator FruR [Psychromonas sp. CNPT3]|uniref:catabolite repressor/activator n=1 Tax=Psychromonas sp. CNPT3 TaxID=314282 RepID=UPI00006E9CC6|nr:catabolite repressor/activator [Psychromonas sp. CNPT3]AGH80181.1 DNA-binding transcriptional regulator FruR [Psychromonas sp. CNPT3]